MSTETCYHCNKQFYADPDLNKAGDESWLCDQCVEKLVRSGVIEDGYHLLPPALLKYPGQ
jgi:NAD-dependent SIR2 family protein deacetylase